MCAVCTPPTTPPTNRWPTVNGRLSSVVEDVASQTFWSISYFGQKPREKKKRCNFLELIRTRGRAPLGCLSPSLSLPSPSNLISKRRAFKSTSCGSSFRTLPQETIIAINFKSQHRSYSKHFSSCLPELPRPLLCCDLLILTGTAVVYPPWHSIIFPF